MVKCLTITFTVKENTFFQNSVHKKTPCSGYYSCSCCSPVTWTTDGKLEHTTYIIHFCYKIMALHEHYYICTTTYEITNNSSKTHVYTTNSQCYQPPPTAGHAIQRPMSQIKVTTHPRLEVNLQIPRHRTSTHERFLAAKRLWVLTAINRTR
jgi:hypothetical protein